MKIWVDADACPNPIKEIVFRAAERRELPALLIANQPVRVPPSRHIKAIQVSGGFDVADDYIVEHADAGDLAITADIPLAALLVEKSIFVIDPRGQEYDEENVRERLAVRDFMDSLRGANVETGGAAPYGAREKQAFAASLDRLLTRAMRVR
jgi:uncharacterized protein YaiI (UPF0178 family)